MYRVGIDVGGTFTDFIVSSEDDDEVSFFKYPSTPDDPSRAIITGLKDIVATLRISPSDISQIGHGTTVATNMIIERRGAATALLLTKGTQDILEIGRQTRPKLYDYLAEKPTPLVRRKNRIEVNERVRYNGEVLVELGERELEAAVEKVKASGVQSIAICFLHSYKNPVHERTLRDLLASTFPDLYICMSSEVLPEFREFERMSTTAMNAYVGPPMKRYMGNLLDEVKRLGVEVEPTTMHSNGGLLSVDTVMRFPVKTCLSGPAAGVKGSVVVGGEAGFRNLITFDVGGTSTDISVVNNGEPLFTSQRMVADFPVKLPMVDISVIGAGGGSIAWMDAGGALKVGPTSAGAVPGPAGYGKGGAAPTLTDANLLLQRLNPVALLDGKFPVYLDQAKAALEAIAAPLGLNVVETATGILEVAVANMARAIRGLSASRGFDLADFTLIAYGGAGPLHATEVAQECGIGTILVPREPGTMCARGMLLSDTSFDFVKSVLRRAKASEWSSVTETFRELQAQAKAWFDAERIENVSRNYRWFVEARYVGQNHEVVVQVDQGDFADFAAFKEKFSSAYSSEYGYELADLDIEVVNCRVLAYANSIIQHHAAREDSGNIERYSLRNVYFKNHGWVETKIYNREDIPLLDPIEGPLIIEEMSSTTVVLPEQHVFKDRHDNLIIKFRG